MSMFKCRPSRLSGRVVKEPKKSKRVQLRRKSELGPFDILVWRRVIGSKVKRLKRSLGTYARTS